VFGTEEAGAAIARMAEQGLIADVFVPLDGNSRLKAERSTAINIGLSANPIEKLNWNLNLFRNDVSDLIESQVFARTTNGQNIFSYRNLRSIYTQGLETDLNYTLGKYLGISAGYQYLLAYDKDVLSQIDAGTIFRRPPGSLQTVRVSRADYGGLFGRSQHMANFKIFYDNKEKGFNANLRMIWRGRYGFGDMNGNLILDSDEEYVAAHQLVNFSAAKLFLKEKLRLQVGIDNLFNFTNPGQIPNMPGRLWYIGISYQLY
jgi:outer membrane receptor for ferrienterochelin and colicins